MASFSCCIYVNVQNKKQVLESSLLIFYLDSFIPECGKEPSLCSAHSALTFYHRFFTSL